MHTKTILAAAIAGGIAVSAQAEQTLEPIVVTATRTAQTVDQTLASVTVIEREEIERLQPAQLSDLLQHRAGLHFASNGPFGKQSSLFMRGTNSSHTVLLIDGVRSGAASNGAAAWETIPVSQIDRIEIVRGPRASIYGADAIGGVVQIFTRRGETGQPRHHGHIRMGSFNTRELGAGTSGVSDSTRWSLSANHLETDGINLHDEMGDADRDGQRQTALSWHLSHRLDNGLELFTSAMHSQGRSDFDVDEYDGWAYIGPYDSAHHDTQNSALRLGMRGDISATWHSELAVAHHRDEATTYYANTFNNRINSHRDQLDWRNDLSLGEHSLWTIGLDLQRDTMDSSTDYDETRRDNQAIYQVLHSELGRHSLQASLRHDDNEAYGSHTTGQLAWGYAFAPQLQGRLSWGTAFKAPSFNDLYWPNSGNPELEPEESASWEAGLRYTQGGLFWDAALHYSEVDNLIAWAPTQAGPWQPSNINRARLQGVEFETGIDQGPWRLALAASLLDAIDRETGNELSRRPRETLRLDLDHRSGDFGLGGSLIAQGRSYDDTNNTVAMPGHGLLNLRASWQASRVWTLRASIDNALDKDYQTIAGYNQPGRAGYLSIHYQQ